MLRINVITLLKWSTLSLSGPIGPTFFEGKFHKRNFKIQIFKNTYLCKMTIEIQSTAGSFLHKSSFVYTITEIANLIQNCEVIYPTVQSAAEPKQY
jgi:hypothetical protein